MFTHYKLGPHVLELELRPYVLGVSRPTVIKWLKPGWRDKRNEVVRRMDADAVEVDRKGVQEPGVLRNATLTEK